MWGSQIFGSVLSKVGRFQDVFYKFFLCHGNMCFLSVIALLMMGGENERVVG